MSLLRPGWYKARCKTQECQARIEAVAFRRAYDALAGMGYGHRQCAVALLQHIEWCLKRAEYYWKKGGNGK